MRRTIIAELAASPAAVFTHLGDLDGYGDWMDLVSRVEPAAAAGGDTGPAWWVTLRAAVGPLARSKRLRMMRTLAEEPTDLRFERCEIDGRSHSPWVLEVAIEPVTAPAEAGGVVTASTVEVVLSYDGGLWDPLLERVLGSNVDASVPRLQALVAESPH